MENESLDLREPGGQRWKGFLSAVRERKPVEDVVRQLELKLPKAMRKAIGEFRESGVQFSDFLASRNDPKKLKAIVKICDGHEYAKQMADTCAAFPNQSDLDLAKQYVNSILDRFQHQVRHEVLGNGWSDLEQLDEYLGQARSEFEKDVHRIASSLVKDRPPTVRKSDKRQKEKDVKTLLGTSLLGRSKS
jgi:hypothetical protein